MRRRQDDRLHVWFLSPSTEVWGAQQSLLTLARHLNQESVHAVLYASSHEWVTEWNALGCEGVHIPTMAKGPAVIRSASWVLSFLRHARNRPDIIVVFDLALAPMVGLFRLYLGSPPVALDLHNYLPTSRGRRRIRWLSRYFDKVIAISRFAASQVSANVPVSVITRPIERDLANDVVAIEDRVIGIIGRLDPDKHLEFALGVAEQLPDARFEVRGAPSAVWDSYAARLRSSAPANVVWVGRLNRTKAFSGLAALFIPNHKEALGRVVLEAQLAGVPVVVPSAGGSVELVEDGITGYVYESCDRFSAVDALRRAMVAPTSILENAKAYAVEVSNPTKYAVDYIQALAGLAQR